jgi:hypothetical protein
MIREQELTASVDRKLLLGMYPHRLDMTSNLFVGNEPLANPR